MAVANGQPMGGEMPITELAGRLGAKGLEYQLTELATWTTLQRVQAAEWTKGNLAEPPEHIRKHFLPPLPQHVTPTTSAVAEVPVSTPIMQSQVASQFDAMTGAIKFTWGEEQYTPVPGSYSTCRVGSFQLDLQLAGATKQNLVDTMRFLTEFAEAERERKLRSFLQMLTKVVEQTKQQHVRN